MRVWSSGGGYNTGMTLDKELYRKAYQSYQEWNEAELNARIQNAGHSTPEDGFSQYLSLWESIRKIGLKPGEWQRREKLAALEHYYNCVRILEEWRLKHGR